tara:strand:- start:292 stop:510 length:219 start_codon:yes stop_codon:yes gene_type:complete
VGELTMPDREKPQRPDLENMRLRARHLRSAKSWLGEPKDVGRMPMSTLLVIAADFIEHLEARLALANPEGEK